MQKKKQTNNGLVSSLKDTVKKLRQKISKNLILVQSLTLQLLNVKPKQEQYHLASYWETKANNILCSLRVLFAVRTVKNKFLFILCLFEPSEPDVLDHMWVHGQEVHQDVCLPLIGPDRKYSGLMGMPL